MNEISEIANLSQKYTNHCIRATSISVLDSAGFEARHIMQISGHKNESSIRSYSRYMPEAKTREISGVLSGVSPSASATSSSVAMATPSIQPAAAVGSPSFSLGYDLLDSSPILTLSQVEATVAELNQDYAITMEDQLNFNWRRNDMFNFAPTINNSVVNINIKNN